MKLFQSHRHIICLAILGLGLFVVPTVANANLIELAGKNVNEALQHVAFFLVTTFIGSFLRIAAELLDFAVNNFVIGFGATFVNSGIGIAVNDTWVIIRDFVNMFFIFGFVYIGFKLILNANDSNTRRWLVNIILAALLVNFSLFATKFVIDVSNQLAAQIAVNGLCANGACTSASEKSKLAQVDISAEFAARMNLTGLVGEMSPNEKVTWGYILGMGFMFLTAMFVFAAGAILLMIRFAVLNLFMILSPAMFLGWVFPPLEGTMKRFWSEFFGRAFFAPIYLLFIYFSLQIISGLQVSIGGNGGLSASSWKGTFQSAESNAPDPSLGSTIPFFILICIFLALSLWAADKLGADGGNKAVGLGKSFANRVRKIAVNNSAGYAARGVNRLTDRVQTAYQRGDAKLANMKGWKGSLARGARSSLNVATLGLTSDKTLQSGFKAGKELRIDGSETADDVDKREAEQRGRQSQALAEMDREKKMKEYNKVIDETAMSANDLQDAFDGMKKTIGEMSNDERIDLGIDKLTSEKYAVHLTDAHIEAMEKSGKYSYQQIQDIKKARSDARVSMSDGGNPPARLSAAERTAFEQKQRQSLVNGSPQDVGKLSVDIFKKVAMAQYLTPAMIEQRMRNGLKDSDRIAIRNNIIATFPPGGAVPSMWATWQNTVYGAQFFS